MAIMGFLAVANAYTMRVCLNIAITQMVRRRVHKGGMDDGACPADISDLTTDATVSTIFPEIPSCGNTTYTQTAFSEVKS
jgi:hypothetical protein